MVWFHWKPPTKKEGNCSGRSWVRRILLTCIQLLLLQFLHVIWSMPTNFAFFKKLLDKFFLQIWQSRDQLSIHIPCKVQEHWNQRRLLNRAPNIIKFSTRFCVYKWASSLFTGIVLTWTFKFSKHIQFASKRTLGTGVFFCMSMRDRRLDTEHATSDSDSGE